MNNRSFRKQVKNILYACVVCFVIFWGSFFIFFGRYDLFRFPFRAEVWGTTDGWMMVIVTVISAYILIKSFDMDRQNMLRKNLPIFNCYSDKNSKPISYLKVNNAPARNVYLIIRDNHFYQSYDTRTNVVFPYEEELILRKKSVIVDGSAIGRQIGLISFEDDFGNKYEQKIFFTQDHLHTDFPIEVN